MPSIFITGGGSGIGAAIVRHFAGQGARVGFLDIDIAASTALKADLGPAAVHFEPCDLRDIPALRAAIAAVAAIRPRRLKRMLVSQRIGVFRAGDRRSVDPEETCAASLC